MMNQIKTDQEISALRTSGRMLAAVLDKLALAVQPEMTTAEINDRAAAELQALGGEPAFLGYYGFTGVICVSINQEVIHGIPSPRRRVKQGDVLSLDFGVKYQGMITDSARTFVVGGEAPARTLELVRQTEAAMLTGIDAARGGNRVGDISKAIAPVLKKGNFGIVKDFVGHGVGHELHEEPNIPNFVSGDNGPVLRPGMTIAIEPMATLGSDQVFIQPDGWTVVTVDGSLAAHFEHTVLITNGPAEILTLNR